MTAALVLAAACVAEPRDETASEPSDPQPTQPSPTAPSAPDVEATAGPPSPTASNRGAPRTSTPTPTPTPREPEGAPIVVAAVGDVHGEPPVGDVLRAGDNPLAAVASTLAAADVAIANLETAVGDRGTPQDKRYRFQADAALMSALADAGVDVVNLANNHSLDYGVPGLRETIALAEDAGLEVVGAGETASQAYAPQLVDVNGTTVAVMGLTHVIPEVTWAATDERPGLASGYDHARSAAAVEAAAEQADHVVVAVHWGTSGAPCPDDDQRALAPALVDAGADVVAGHHPHRLQALTHPQGAVISWSLGNFVWYPTGETGRRSGILQAELGADGDPTGHLAPVFIDDRGRPRPAGAERAAAIREQVAELARSCKV